MGDFVNRDTSSRHEDNNKELQLGLFNDQDAHQSALQYRKINDFALFTTDYDEPDSLEAV